MLRLALITHGEDEDDNKLMFEVDFDCDCHYEIIEAKFEYGMIDKFGKTVFLTPEEVVKAIAERECKD